jgi:hypothetical protein
MTDEMLFGAIFGVLCVMALYFGSVSYRLVKYHLTRRKMRTQGANVIKANPDEAKACRHSWDEVTLGMLSLPVGKYKVCTTCGYICGTDLKLNKPAMEAFAEGRLKRAEVKKEQDYLKQRLEDEILRRRTLWIEQNLHRFVDVANVAISPRMDDETNDANVSAHFHELLEHFGVYMRKEYQKAVEKVYEEEKARR